ncbi:hypothetical protein Taro_054559 [Colocasia esculenta]|uniref:RNase H type-1 domain-containing protein n=1 Tax=Colocasia esculenta TaxID=4460 RepID=A0A843XP58_COLES|nr:hypothetical protein [Colocasia esculenta]
MKQIWNIRHGSSLWSGYTRRHFEATNFSHIPGEAGPLDTSHCDFCLNVDGASKGNLGICGRGGCIPNSHGNVLVAFANFYGEGNNIIAETRALCDGLLLAHFLGVHLSAILYPLLTLSSRVDALLGTFIDGGELLGTCCMRISVLSLMFSDRLTRWQISLLTMLLFLCVMRFFGVCIAFLTLVRGLYLLIDRLLGTELLSTRAPEYLVYPGAPGGTAPLALQEKSNLSAATSR